MEDLDSMRLVAGADLEILRTLTAFGLGWDGPVLYQSRRVDAYAAALEKLKRENAVYPCICSRREVAGIVYPGTCRNGAKDAAKPKSWRVRVDSAPVRFEDRRFGMQQQNLARDGGDFVVLRSDGVFAYQRAVVVDDAAQGVTDIVRGGDLLDSTPRQIYPPDLLGLPQMRCLHIPVVTNNSGEKLSKQTFAPPLNTNEPAAEPRQALRFLGQAKTPGRTPNEIPRAAAANWNAKAISRETRA